MVFGNLMMGNSCTATVDKLSKGTLKWSKSEDVTNTAEVVHLKQKLHICIFDLVKNDGCKSPPLALTLVFLCVQK